jgi:hypothetical protein
LHAAVDRRRPATGIVPDDKQPGRLRDGDGGVGTAAIHRQHLRRRRLERGERAQCGSPAASFSIGMTMATSVIALG